MTVPVGTHLAQVSGTQLAAMFDSIPTRIALLDGDRRYRYVNREYIRFVDRPMRDILGRTVSEIFSEDGFAEFHAQDGRALAGETTHWEGWLEHRDGRRYLQRTCVPLRDDAGVIDGYFIFNLDLTDLKRGEMLNAAIVASALDCFITIDEDGLVVEFNPAAEQTFGRRRADVLGRKIGDLIVPPALRKRHADGFARYLRTGEAHVIGRRIEIEAMRADATVFPVELTIAEVRLPDRRLFTAHLRDLTASRAAAAEIQRQREALHQSEKMAAFGSLLAGVAHELNNPLSIVIGNALMLNEEAEHAAPSLAERARRVQAAAERCGATVRSFLAMARHRDILKRPFAARTLIKGALGLLDYGIRSGGVIVHHDVPPDLPELSCDGDQVQQILTNLLLNAAQALEPQPPPRRIRIAARADGAWIDIAVEDNGPGVSEADRGRIFDPFFTTKPVGAGTGIGLKVSRGIAEAHGGTLTLASCDTGARFVLRLPCAPPRHAAEPAGRVGGRSDAAAHTKRTALIVDDEEDVANLLGEMLTGQGFLCDVATSGAAALRLMASAHYDAILCDVRMPDIDGAALYAWAVEHRPSLCARIAFVTGDTLGAAAGRFLAEAGRPILEKPFLPAELRSLVAQLVKPDAANFQSSTAR